MTFHCRDWISFYTTHTGTRTKKLWGQYLSKAQKHQRLGLQYYMFLIGKVLSKFYFSLFLKKKKKIKYLQQQTGFVFVHDPSTHHIIEKKLVTEEEIIKNDLQKGQDSYICQWTNLSLFACQGQQAEELVRT